MSGQRLWATRLTPDKDTTKNWKFKRNKIQGHERVAEQLALLEIANEIINIHSGHSHSLKRTS